MSVPRRYFFKIITDILELKIKLTNLRSDLASETTRLIVVGDTIEILNKYKGYKVTIGTVTKVARTLITIKTKQGEELKRAPKNLKKVY